MSKLTFEYENCRIRGVLVDGQRMGCILHVELNGGLGDVIHDCVVHVLDPASLPADAKPELVAGVRHTYETLSKVFGVRVVRIPIQNTNISPYR